MTTVTTIFKECRLSENHLVMPFDAYIGACSGPLLVYRTSNGWGHVSCERHAKMVSTWAWGKQYNHKVTFSAFLTNMDDCGREEFEQASTIFDLTGLYEPYTGHKVTQP